MTPLILASHCNSCATNLWEIYIFAGIVYSGGMGFILCNQLDMLCLYISKQSKPVILESKHTSKVEMDEINHMGTCTCRKITCVILQRGMGKAHHS